MSHTDPDLPPLSTVPCLIYDGDCGICAWWVRYWRRLTGERVRYAPYQEVAGRYPEIPQSEFEKAIHFIPAKGRPAKGAHAAFRVLAQAAGAGNGHGATHGWWLNLYRLLPGFAPISEFVYRKVAANRTMFARLTWLAYGRRELQPVSHDAASWLFLRIFGLILLSAFISFAVQAQGLIGSEGIVPIAEWFPGLVEKLGYGSVALAPSLFWFYQADWFIWLVLALGMVGSLLVMANRWTLAGLVLAYVSYLSLVHGGRQFMTFQWDVLLLETTFLAMLLVASQGPWRTLVIWGFRWLLFRFIFLSGFVKLASGDTAWWDLTALNYHFETQPLPTLLAWHAHHLPDWMLQLGTGGTLFIELCIGFLLFAPRRIRFMAAGLFVLFELTIIATGNYNFFNLLSILLCLMALDDQALSRFRRSISVPLHQGFDWRTRTIGRVTTLVLLLWFMVSALFTAQRLGLPSTETMVQLRRHVQPFAVANNYGPFATMTKVRNEIEVQGSMNGEDWESYRFRFKPDALDGGLPWIIPHQPRLDWQMWFAVLGPADRSPWLTGFLRGLLLNREPVLGLLAHNPFPGQAPQFIRFDLYRYRFTTPEERERTGNTWQRDFDRPYIATIENPFKKEAKTETGGGS
ncbi:MAG: lipase maturation factor family protein [Gammaproteobacteria bacterium]